MICNVCGEDKRCFTLTETTRPVMSRTGMIFALCADCLGKLIEPIKTDNTVIDDPAMYPLPTGELRRMEAMSAQRATMRSSMTPVTPTKITE